MKKVLITGASSGIGKELACYYATQNHHVIACGRNTERLDALANLSPFITPLIFDVEEPNDILQAVAAIEPVDIAILNAGNCEYIDDSLHFDGDAFARMINVNLISIGYLLQNILPKMKSNGQLVLVSSSVTFVPLPRAEAYGASKAGLDYLAKVLQVTLREHDIGVTLVQPGFVDTPLTNKNTFPMPFMVSAKDAAIRIYNGVSVKNKTIHFPRRFTYFLKLLALLPDCLWHRFATKLVSK